MTMKTNTPQASGIWEGLQLDPRHAHPSDGSGRFEIGELAATRAEILSIQAEAALLERPRLALALMRLALMTELLDCLWTESPSVAIGLASFCDQGFQKLHLELGEADEESAVSWMLNTSTERWGSYLELLDNVDETKSTSSKAMPGDRAAASSVADLRDEDESEHLRRILMGESPPSAAASKPAGLARCKGPETPQRTAQGVRPNSSQPRQTTAKAEVEVPEVLQAVVIDPEFAETFLDEANDLFERVQGLVLNLVPGKDHRPVLLELGRCFHTLKGAAGSVGLVEFAGLIHSAEEAIESSSVIGEGTSALIDLLHKLLRYMETLFQAIRSGMGSAAVASSSVGRAATPSAMESVPSAQAGSSRPGDRSFSSNRSGSRRNGDAPSAVTPEPVLPSPTAAVETPPPLEGPVRISSERLDELMDLVSELITRRGLWSSQSETLKEFAILAKTSRNRMLSTVDQLQDLRPPKSLARAAKGYQERPSDLPELSRRLAEQADDLIVLTDSAQALAKPLSDNSDALARLTLKIWESLQALRIVPVKGLFHRLARVAHDAARVEGRRIEIIMTGEEIGLDRAVQDKAFEPMLHIVRNAVAHGIEPAAERRKIGKRETGIVYLEAARSGNTMVLTVRDDGKGLDYRAIEEKGRRLGLIAHGETPDIARLNNLIFQPGFSTKDEANAISGRGVGMDVVTQEVSRIHGTVVLNSVRGQGTNVSLHLPAKLSLVQAMLVRVDEQLFSLPVELIEAVETLNREEIEFRQGKAWVKGRDDWAPLVSARDALGIAAASEPSCPKILLVRVEGKPLAVLVDSIDGSREMVIKPLGPLVSGHPIVSGTSLLVTGEVVLALNPSGLSRSAQMEMGGGPLPYSNGPSTSSRIVILVVDDSISVRKVVARQLRSLGHDVDEASDGLEALGKLRERRYAMVLTDLEMPRMDGFELLVERAEHPWAKTTPVVVASTRSDDATRKRIVELGANAFIPKPIDSEELAAAVNRWTKAGFETDDSPCCAAVACCSAPLTAGVSSADPATTER